MKPLCTSQASTQSWLTSTTISSVVMFLASICMSVLGLQNRHGLLVSDENIF
jgi:hypothetical protein